MGFFFFFGGLSLTFVAWLGFFYGSLHSFLSLCKYGGDPLLCSKTTF